MRSEKLPCPEPGCGSTMSLRHGRFRLFYGCDRFPECKGSHGAHPDGRPLGTPAPQATKDARKRAHDVFDRLWKGARPTMSRGQAYAWMADVLGQRDPHIGNMDEEECERLIRLVENEREEA